MMNKYCNNAIIGNKNIVASFSENGELQRLCFPAIDNKQFVDHFHTGVKINDSNIIYLHQDINNNYNQKYIENTNILVTNIQNTYFNLNIEQTDCILIKKNILVKKYVFKNSNTIDLNVKFIINSKIQSSDIDNFGSRIINNGVIQYNHNYSVAIYSDRQIYSHKLNDVQSVLYSAVINDKDYIGMSNEIAISFDIENLKPNEEKELIIYLLLDESKYNIEEKIEKNNNLNINGELEDVKKYWQNYVLEHNKIISKHFENKLNKKIIEIYNRTILLFPLLINYDTGGIAAALELDENRSKCGGYCYCWPRDSIFITKAFDLLNMELETDLFYNNFCKRTQSSNGMWEQRFYTDGILAPCWGYQIDETASVIYGIYNHYKYTKNIKFLQQNLKQCENAVKFLINYTENLLQIEEDLVKKELKQKYNKKFEIYKQHSYDLWEMNEGVHLYSISSIIASFESMKKIYEVINIKDEKSRLKKEKRNNLIAKLNKYIVLLKEYIKTNLIDSKLNILKRNLEDSNMDISIIGAIYPFNIFMPTEKVVQNTIEKINMTLRTHTNGYLRFENDNYMGGNNPWIITTLWMALYYIKSGNIEQAEKCFNFVVDTSCKYGFLSEQVNNEDKNFKWVIGLGWSHAMFIIVLEELIKIKEGN